eukprot:scaffold2848_cov352-Pavlova_lutheri.AAC.41
MGLGDPVSIGDGIRFRLGWKGRAKGKGKSFSMGPSPCEKCCEKSGGGHPCIRFHVRAREENTPTS